MSLFCHILSATVLGHTFVYLQDPIFKLEKKILKKNNKPIFLCHKDLMAFNKVATYRFGLFMFKLNKDFLPNVISEQFL